MTRGYAYVVGEFVLVNKRGVISNQRTVSGYSRIGPLNTQIQREMAYENAVKHARSKYLYALHKPSDEDVDWAIVDSGFNVEYIEKGERKFRKSDRIVKARERQKVNTRILEYYDRKREDEDKTIKRSDVNKMYAKEPKKKKTHVLSDEEYKEYKRLRAKEYAENL